VKKITSVVALSAIGIGLSALPSFAAVSTNNDADLAGTSAYIRNSWVQGGLKENGSFGTEEAVPSNYDSLFESQGGGLGLIDDATENGFDINDNGDFFLPGQPYEAWGIKVDGNPTLVNNDGETDIAGSWTSSETTGDASVTWESTSPVDGISVTQVVSAPAAGDHLLRVTVTLENTDSVARTVFYARQVDPDNNVDTGGEYETFNRIIANSTTSQIVTGTAYDTAFSTIGYRAADPDAVVRISDWSWPLAGDDVEYTEAEMDANFAADRDAFKVGYQDYLDSTIDIYFRKEIAAGASAVVAFDYILNPKEVDVPALALDLSLELEVGASYGGASTALSGGGLAPNSTYTLTEFSVPNVIFTGTTLPNGNFYDETALPDECRPGSHTLVLSGTSPAGIRVSDLVTYTVDESCIVTAFDPYAAANGAPNPDVALADTGADSGQLALLGGLAALSMVAGAAVVVRRRKA
jgi:LPXTG-motif cell wall-anchored protein